MSSTKRIHLIAGACQINKRIYKDKEGGIGINGNLPWPRLIEDMEFFKSVTTFNYLDTKNVVIMGRKTWDSIPIRFKPLPDRLNVIISSMLRMNQIPEVRQENVMVFATLAEALEFLNSDDYGEIFLIGGERIYTEGIEHKLCDYIFLNRIHNRYVCDTFFPHIDKQKFKLLETINSSDHEVSYTFEIYRKSNLDTQLDPKMSNMLKIFYSKFDSETDETQYLDLVKKILKEGKKREDRTGTGTYSVYGHQLRFNARETIPILTTKRVYWRGVVEELLWFLKGDTNIQHLINKNVHIWDGNSTREYLDSIGLPDREERDGGPIYGFQWRHFGAEYTTMHDNYDNKGVDQLQNCIDLINNNPTSRRIIMTAWNPLALKDMCLPPCHVQYQFYVDIESNEISCHMYQRSADVFLGLPFNIASTALLTYIIAYITNKKVGDIIISLGDAHIYTNHVEQCCEQLKRKIRPFPKLVINAETRKIEELVFDDFKLEGYNPHATIKAKMAV